MLIIRKEQMDILGKYMLKQFENSMLVHLQTKFSDSLKGTPESDLRIMIQEGIDKATQYNVNAEDDVQLYLECMVIYGSDFDTNPETSWAGDILSIMKLDGSKKMDFLEGHVQRFLDDQI